MVDPPALQRYSVIRVYYAFEDQPAEQKFFVVLCHDKDHAICLKATSKTLKYESDEKQKSGCVFYSANEVPCFPENTAIQPDNIVPIPHKHIVQEAGKGRFEDKGLLPADFHGKIVAAIKASITITPKRKKLLLEFVGEKV